MMYNDIILLSGSYARGTNTERSDIDWIVISENVCYFHTETVWHEGKETQIILMPRQKIHKMVMEKSYNSHGVIMSMLQSCLVIRDDGSNFINRLTKYVESHYEDPVDEHMVASYLSTLSNRCDDLENTDDEFARAMYVSTIMVQLSHVLTNNYITGTKHSIRKILSSHVRDELLAVYCKYSREGDCSAILEYARKQIEIFKRDILTSGKSLNNVKEKDPIVIFIPKKKIYDKGVFKLIADISTRLKGCDFHVFNQGKWQAMNEGVYVYVSSHNMSAAEICQRIRTYDITVAKSRIALGIDMTYPYYTTFATGAYFGGRNVLDVLVPCFSAVWNEFFQTIVNKSGNFVATYSLACGMALIGKISVIAGYEYDFLTLLKGILDLLLPDVLDRHGLYNAEQTRYLRKVTLENQMQQYVSSKDRFISTLTDVESGNVEELIGMNNTLDSLVEVIGGIKAKTLDYPDIYPFDNPVQVFLMETILHVLSIFQLSQEQKFGIVFNYSMYKGLCLDDFLSPGR